VFAWLSLAPGNQRAVLAAPSGHSLGRALEWRGRSKAATSAVVRVVVASDSGRCPCDFGVSLSNGALRTRARTWTTCYQASGAFSDSR
jgi:hypothetical protein